MTRSWFKAAGIRALKTFAQTVASLITVGAMLTEIEWGMAVSCGAVAAIYSLLMSVAGLPEVEEDPEEDLEEEEEQYEE